MAYTKPIHVLFVCLGNICRSPMAEAVFRQQVEQAGLADRIKADSAGTEHYHIGSQPHQGTRRILRLRGITYQHVARRIVAEDSKQFDYIILLEASNMSDVRFICRHTTAHMGLLLDFAPQTGLRDVPDPYYTGGFEQVYDLVEQGCRGLLQHIVQQAGLSPQTSKAAS